MICWGGFFLVFVLGSEAVKQQQIKAKQNQI
jgi:hypothetical protein